MSLKHAGKHCMFFFTAMAQEVECGVFVMADAILSIAAYFCLVSVVGIPLAIILGGLANRAHSEALVAAKHLGENYIKAISHCREPDPDTSTRPPVAKILGDDASKKEAVEAAEEAEVLFETRESNGAKFTLV